MELTKLENVEIIMYPGVGGAKLYLVDTLEKFDVFYKLLMQQKLIACDTETSGLQWFKPEQRIIGLSFGWDTTHFYIPLRHETSFLGGKPGPQIEMSSIKDRLKVFFAQKDILVLFHNWIFDAHFYQKEGIPLLAPFQDTRVLWQLYDENAPGKLKVIASGWTDDMGRRQKGIVHPDAAKKEKEISIWRGKEASARRKELTRFIREEAEAYRSLPEYQHMNKTELKKALRDSVFINHPYANATKESIHYGFVPIQLMCEYAGLDTFFTWKIYKYCIKNISWTSAMKSLFLTECKLSKAIFRCEENGVCIDSNLLEEAGKCYEKSIIELEKKIQELLGDVNLDSPQQLAAALIKHGVILTKKTSEDSDQFCVDKGVLSELSDEYPIANDIIKLRALRKLKNTYVDSILEKLMPGNILHCSFNQNVTTGRMCIAEGTYIHTPCDRSEFPKGKPIEYIKAGDYVYCYDDDGNLHLRKVLWAGCKGNKETIRINWIGQGNKHKGELVLTPDHRVRLFDGTWVEAQDLQENDRIMALSGNMKGPEHDKYYYLYGRYSSNIREHKFVMSSLGLESEVVHHKDGNKLNNSINNLEPLPVKEHVKQHPVDLDVLYERVKHLHTVEARKKQLESIKYGVDHQSWKHINRNTLLRWAAINKGNITAIMKYSGMDHDCLLRKYTLENINLELIKLRYNKNGVYLSKRLVREASELKQPDNYKSLKLGYYNFKKLLNFYGLENNHRVLTIEKVGTRKVYDLEVEEFNNFIAGELCVHNSSSDPNLQNIPGGEDDTIRRSFVIPNDEYIYLLVDYSQIEVRLTAHFSQDPLLLDAYARGQDVHTRTMCEVFGEYYEEAVKILDDHNHPRHKELDILRTITKRVNFGIIYGVGAPGLSEQIPRPDQFMHLTKKQWVKQCDNYIQDYLSKYLGVKRFVFTSGRTIYQESKITNAFGRIRHLPHARATQIYKDRTFRWLEARAKRQATNFVVQGTAADLFKEAIVRVDELFYKNNTKSHIVNFVHDEMQIYLHKSELYLLPEIKKRMQDFPQFSVPIIADFSWSLTNWGEKKKLKV